MGVWNKAWKIIKPKQKTYGTGAIKSVPPSVGDKSLSKLKITVAKTKGSAAKLKQTLWESKHKKREERFTFAYDKGNVAKKSKKKDSRKWDQALKEYVKK